MTDTEYDGGSKRWANIDGQSQAAARYLEMMNRVLEEQKRQTMEWLNLAPGMSVLEVGCGLGLDAEAMAPQVAPAGRVVGIDASYDLIGKARERTAGRGLPLEFAVGDAHALGFPDNAFGAARIDRVLQHLRDPEQAVREMARVVRPGGRIAVLEPDWESVCLGGVDREIARAVVRYKSDVSLAHGTIGREVRRVLVEAGCVDVLAQHGSVTFADLALAERVMSLRRSLDGAVSGGWVAPAAADAWWHRLEELDRTGRFFSAMCGVMAVGTVPPER
jgi:ubiquinone/menaquinone biosynthesis C-methylase UbiE